MKALEWSRKIVGAALLLCGWAVALYVLSGLLGRRTEFLGEYLAWCWLVTAPLSLLHALLSLPGGVGWEERLRRAMGMKLLLIPFFLANFILGLAGVAVFFLGGLLLTLLAALMAFLALLATSVDVIRALTILNREGRMTTGQVICHSILQLIYCADVIDVCALWHSREKYAASLNIEP